MRKLIIGILVVFGFGLLVPVGFSAVLVKESFNAGLEATGRGSGYDVDRDEEGSVALVDTIDTLIGVVLSLVGIVLVVLMLYAGFNWMTAAGDADKVKVAQDTIKRAMIGLLIVVSAYGISSFVLDVLVGAGGGSGSEPAATKTGTNGEILYRCDDGLYDGSC